jgi:phosphatidylinositol alpha-1,6-mannosyltransferase
VIFAGYVSDEELVDYYNACDVFLLPCREIPGGDVEGFGIVFLEANACVKPVVAGRSGGVVEAVDDQCTGILVDPKSEEEISQAVIRLLTDPDLCQNLGQQGRARVLERFTWDAVGMRFHCCMSEAMDRKRAGGPLPVTVPTPRDG